MRICKFKTHDVRFPTSREMHGSDAMNPDPDYSCAYIELETDGEITGRGLTFTIGRGNEICVAAIEALAPALVGLEVDDLEGDPALASRLVMADSQYRWLGPEKGVMHLAAAAIVNAVWDLMAKRAELPLWRYIAGLPPDQIARSVNFTHISEYLCPEEALEMLRRLAPTRSERIADLEARGYPAYTTSAGWIGYSDDEIRSKLNAAYAEGWRHFKIKVGRDLEEDIRRCRIVRETLGDDVRLSVDANQVWGVNRAIECIRAMAEFNLYWVEEPTSPDDVIGHRAIAEAVAPIRLATGEHAHNRIMFKQFLQANAIGFCQIDACRLAGVNEALAVMLMAAKAGIPICPHAGGVGLCEYVQHLSMVDYVCISGRLDDRVIEHAGQLHHHFIEPIRVVNGRYMPPERPGYSVDMHPASLKEFAFPDGPAWK